MNISFLLTAGISFILFIFSITLFLAKLYKRCPSNKVLVVYGKVGEKQAVQCYH